MTPGRPDAIVLCGGQSTRMGRDKASLPFGPETLLERVVRLVAEATSAIVLAAAPEQAVPEGYRVSRDTVPAGGPVPALLGALSLVEAPQVFVVACDTPLLQVPLVALLAARCDGWDAAVPVVGGRRVPTCAVYDTAALRRAGHQLGAPANQSLQALLATLRVREVPTAELQEADPQLLSFTPCNTEEEYAGLQASCVRLQGL